LELEWSALETGTFVEPLDSLLGQETRPKAIPTGADEAAELILKRLMQRD
jgi:hypothetical protein